MANHIKQYIEASYDITCNNKPQIDISTNKCSYKQ